MMYLFVVMLCAMFAFLVSMVLIPFSMNRDKIKKGHSRIEMSHVPEVFYKEWYQEDKIWVRNMFVISLGVLLCGFLVIGIFG